MSEPALLAAPLVEGFAEPAPAAPQPSYSYVFTDLLTDRVIGAFDMTDVEFDVFVTRPGELRGRLPVPNAKVGARARQIIEGRTAVYVQRSLGPLTEVWWGGIVWTAPRTWEPRATARIDITAATFDSYLDRVDVLTALTQTQVDQLAIERLAWTRAQTVDGSDLGVVIPAAGASGVMRDVDVQPGAASSYGQAVADLKALDDSWESVVRVSLQPDGTRRRELVQGYPLLGTPKVHRFAKPGSLIRYDISGDATAGATRFRARGDAASSNQAEEQTPLLSQPVLADDLLAAGWPLLDMVSDHSDVTDPAVLDVYAQNARYRYSGTVRRPSFTVAPGAFSPAQLGDLVSIETTDELFPDGLQLLARAVGVKVRPSGRGGIEELDIIVDEEAA